MTRILLIDNYDSFTFNLYQYLCELGAEVIVHRNDEITVDEAGALDLDGIVISPGPKTPAEAGASVPIIREFAGRTPILGVCLGHQCIGAAFGATVGPAGEIRHGKTSGISHDGAGVFAGLPDRFEATRYHSLAVDPETLPAEIEATAWAERPDGTPVLMGLRHREYAVEGVQFHPESIMTKTGHAMLRNFLRTAGMAEEGADGDAGGGDGG